MKTSAILVLCGLAAGASGQGTVEYCFEGGDTGDGDGIIEPGEAAYITIIATVDPDQSGNGGGFAGSIFDLVGIDGWDTGTVELYEAIGNFGHLSSHGNLQLNNDITGIEVFRLPMAFDPEFDLENPIGIYRLIWSPDDYTPRTVEAGLTNHLNNSVYVDEFGTSVEFQPTWCGPLSIPIIPTPSSLALLGMGGLVACRRRR